MISPPFIAIDPGVSGLGYAVFTGVPDVVSISRAGVIHPQGDGSWLARSSSVVDRLFRAVIKDVLAMPARPDQIAIVLESQELFSSSAKGWASAKKGDIFKLTMMTGAIADRFRYFREINLVAPRTWKGQLSKRVTKARVTRRIGDAEVTKLGMVGRADHVWDAVGIGLWAAEGAL